MYRIFNPIIALLHRKEVNNLIVRNTSIYPTTRVKELVKFAVNSFHTGVCINVKNSSNAYGGYAYHDIPSISNAPRSSRYLVTIRIGKPSQFPCKNYGSTLYKRVPEFDFLSWEEALVAVVAHELQHVRQFVRRLPISESKATLAEYKKLMEFRSK